MLNEEELFAFMRNYAYSSIVLPSVWVRSFVILIRISVSKDVRNGAEKEWS